MRRKFYCGLIAALIFGSLLLAACKEESYDGQIELKVIRQAKAELYVNDDLNPKATVQALTTAVKTVNVKTNDVITIKHEAVGPDDFVSVTAKRKDNNQKIKVSKVDPMDDYNDALRKFTMPAGGATVTVTYVDQSSAPYRNIDLFPSFNDNPGANGGYIECDLRNGVGFTGCEPYILAFPENGKKLSTVTIHNTDNPNTKVTVNATDDENIKTFTIPAHNITITATFVNK